MLSSSTSGAILFPGGKKYMRNEYVKISPIFF